MGKKFNREREDGGKEKNRRGKKAKNVREKNKKKWLPEKKSVNRKDEVEGG